jgi:hypothetical protein
MNTTESLNKERFLSMIPKPFDSSNRGFEVLFIGIANAESLQI